MTILPEKAKFRISEVAEYFGVHPNTVRKWIEKGLISGIKVGGTCWRISREAILAFESLKNIPKLHKSSQSFTMQK